MTLQPVKSHMSLHPTRFPDTDAEKKRKKREKRKKGRIREGRKIFLPSHFLLSATYSSEVLVLSYLLRLLYLVLTPSTWT